MFTEIPSNRDVSAAMIEIRHQGRPRIMQARRQNHGPAAGGGGKPESITLPPEERPSNQAGQERRSDNPDGTPDHVLWRSHPGENDGSIKTMLQDRNERLHMEQFHRRQQIVQRQTTA